MMRQLVIVALGLLCLATLGSPGPIPAGERGSKNLLPANAVWERRLDERLDGRLRGKILKDKFRIMVRNNKLTGHPEGDKRRAQVAGEIVAGQPPIVYWRQDNNNPELRPYTQIFSGKLVAEGRIVGTWYGTTGRSGDFELVL
jgi:hypothetical protein